MSLPNRRKEFRILFIVLCLFFFSRCNEAYDTHAVADSSLLDAEFALSSWPNSTTTLKNSSIVSSMILVSDLNNDGVTENVFISHILHSTDTNSSVVRITEGISFNEIANFTSQRAHLFKEAMPFAYDIDGDGLRELFFISKDRDQLYAIEFHNKDLRKVNIRWKIDFPNSLPQNFDRKIRLIDHNGKKAIKIGPMAIYESAPRMPTLDKL